MTSQINNAVETFRLEIETLEQLKNSIDENFEKEGEIMLENNR
ncbi:D-arabinose 5-phosphate isomerase, partial [Francisella tularensis subsp. holarctica]|nr:D-arabinose 5-phosphate isomerase [Francisella tularensis subsp. holarctica]